MPTYTYRCSACDHAWEAFNSMADYLKPCDEPCPECEALKVTKAVDGFSGVQIDTKHDCRNTKNLPGGFRERMNQIADGLSRSDGSQSRMRDQYK